MLAIELRSRRGSLKSLLKAIGDGDAMALTLVGLFVAMIVVGFLVLSRLATAGRQALEEDTKRVGRDLALVRRVAIEDRMQGFVMAGVWWSIGLFVAIPSFVGSLPDPFDFGEPGFWLWSGSLVLSTVAAAFPFRRARRTPEVDEHPFWQLASDNPDAVQAFSFARHQGVVYLYLKARDREEAIELRFNESWGAELLDRLQTIFPNAKFGPAVQV